MRALVLATSLLVLLCAAVPAQAQPTSPSGAQHVRWRDLSFDLFSDDWERAGTDPEPTLAGKRLVYLRQDPLHQLRLNIQPLEAPPALAPSEVFDRFVENQRKTIEADAAFTDFKAGAHTVAGVDYPAVTVRYTPASPPMVDQIITVVFPADYADRQRYLLVHLIDRHSGTTAPISLDEYDRIIASLTLQPLGTVLVSDDFTDPENGAMHRSASTDHYDAGYLDGEFSVLRSDPSWTNFYSANVPGTFVDASIAVDVYLPSEQAGMLVALWCRRTTSNGSYRAEVEPAQGRAMLQRVKTDGSITSLSQWVTSDAIRPASTNRLELTCRGSQLQLDSNGTHVVSARNTDLIEGQFSIGGGAFSNRSDLTPEFRFANLVVSQR